MEKMNQRQKQAIETKLKITSSAMELFSRGSSQEVKISDICRNAGVSVGLFYHYFESKDAIIREAYDGIDSLIVERFLKLKPRDSIEGIVLFMKTCGEMISSLGVAFVSNAYRQCLLDGQEFTTSRDRILYRMIESLAKAALEENKVVCSSLEEFIDTVYRMARGDTLSGVLNLESHLFPP